MKTNRLILVSLLLLILALSFASCGLTGSAAQGPEYVPNTKSDGSGDGTCYVVWNGELNANIVIPSVTTNGLTVTGIGASAFYGKSGTGSISIPESVTNVGLYAFAGSTNLTALTVAENNPVLRSAGNCVIEIETKTVVRGCNSSVIPTDGSVTAIGSDAFSVCTALGTTVEEGKRVATAFVIPASIKTVGRKAFDGCVGLSVVRYTGDLASWCGITFDGFLANPNIYAAEFYVKDVEIADELAIPAGVTAIKDFAFAGCAKVTKVAFPDGLEAIERGAFYGCSGLTEIELPESVDFLGDHAFRNCSSLTRITFAGTKAEWEGLSKGSDWDSGTGAYTVACSDGVIE